MDDLALLRLQIEWGADETLEDAPVDRLRPIPTPTRPAALPARHVTPPGSGAAAALGRPTSAPGAAQAPTPAPVGTPAQRAMAAAGQEQTISDLRAALVAFNGCALRDTAANLVFAAGDPHATLLLIGEPPGEAEDRSGQPFAGPDGALLDRMLTSIGLSREAMLCTPLIPWRPPGGRVPNPGEIAVCLPFLYRLIALTAPRRLLIAGPTAARHLLTTRRRAGAAWTDMAVPGLSTPLPALVMPSLKMVAQTPTARREAWAALRLLRRTLDADSAST